MITAFLERMLTSKGTRARREHRERVLNKERNELAESQMLLRGEVRQNAQLVESSSRVMDTLTHAMIMMEAPRGRPEK